MSRGTRHLQPRRGEGGGRGGVADGGAAGDPGVLGPGAGGGAAEDTQREQSAGEGHHPAGHCPAAHCPPLTLPPTKTLLKDSKLRISSAQLSLRCWSPCRRVSRAPGGGHVYLLELQTIHRISQSQRGRLGPSPG